MEDFLEELSFINATSLDIETISDNRNSIETKVLQEKVLESYSNIQHPKSYSKAETIEKWYEKKNLEKQEMLASCLRGEAFDPFSNKIVCYSLAQYQNTQKDRVEESEIFEVTRYLNNESKYITYLQNFSEKLQKINQIITYNGDSFDIPTIKFQFLLNNIQIPDCLGTSKDLKWWFSYRDFNGKPVIKSLPLLVAKFLNIDLLETISGKEVEEYWLEGKKDKIIDHNRDDSIATLLLANKIYQIDPVFFSR